MTGKPECPKCGSTKLRRVLTHKRTHQKYIPMNAARCLHCKRSWWVPFPYTNLKASPMPYRLVDGVRLLRG